jgi:Pentapeptide repeats (9 copies)
VEAVLEDVAGEGVMRVLTPANENPWYVLMTLYGEQDGEDVDSRLHQKNRAAWNAWACQNLSPAEREAVAESSRVTVEELAGWEAQAEDITKRHEAAMRARNGAGFSYRGLPGVDKLINLSRFTFAHRIHAIRMVFSGDVRFISAAFNRDASFSSATFSKDVSFVSATFNGAARFDRVTFTGGARFVSTTFNGYARFNQTAFGSNARFSYARFGGDVTFGSTVFAGFAYFIETTFCASGQDRRASFVDCKFENPTNFRAAVFRNRYPDFSGAILHDKTTFTPEDAHWPKTPKDPSDAKASCAVVRHTVGKQGLPEDEHFFFRREMGFAAQIGGFWDRLPYGLFGAVSDYGYSIARPVIWLAALWLASAVVFLLAFRTCYCIADVHNIWFALGLSASNIVNFFGFQRAYFYPTFLAALHPALKFLSAVQTILGFTLLFFFGLGLRTRFRMR